MRDCFVVNYKIMRKNASCHGFRNGRKRTSTKRTANPFAHVLKFNAPIIFFKCSPQTNNLNTLVWPYKIQNWMRFLHPHPHLIYLYTSCFEGRVALLYPGYTSIVMCTLMTHLFRESRYQTKHIETRYAQLARSPGMIGIYRSALRVSLSLHVHRFEFEWPFRSGCNTIRTQEACWQMDIRGN